MSDTPVDLANMGLNAIDVESITNAEKTGVFDKLMLSINNNITEQYEENRINNTEFATVYLGSIQAVLAQSIQFALQEQLSEVQIASAIADNKLKAKQLDIATIEENTKQYELTYILPEQLS